MKKSEKRILVEVLLRCGKVSEAESTENLLFRPKSLQPYFLFLDYQLESETAHLSRTAPLPYHLRRVWAYYGQTFVAYQVLLGFNYSCT